MQISGLPTRISVPFASSGKKNTIPVDSQIGITAGAASFTDGFPPLTMTSVSAGGVPPYGADFNGILNAITVAIRWNAAGSGYPFDNDFASSVAGYPEGALLPASDYSGYWLNTVDANSTAPENSTSDTTGWVPGVNYGVTAITGLSGSSVTLTTLQAAKSRITLAGTLTSNINLIFPAWTFGWTIVNNCTGSFSVTCTTSSGIGVAVPAGMTANLICDGINIFQDTSILGVSGRLLNVQRFTASGTYTPTPGTKTIIVEVLGAGGGGGGAGATSSTTYSAGGSGSGGGYAMSLLNIADNNITTVSVTVGVGGAAGNGSPTGGSPGGLSSFGSFITANGGYGSLAQTPQASDFTTTGTYGGTATGGNIINKQGYSSGSVICTGGLIIIPAGANSIYGAGGTGYANWNVAGKAGAGYGSGGSGASSNASPSAYYSGGAGAGGIVIVWEYA